MIKKIEFKQCLEELLNILDISGIKLAKAINVDPSLVSKWRNGKRVVSSKSNHIELISDYIAKNIKKECHIKEVIEFMNKLDISIHGQDSKSFKKYIYHILSVSNQNSRQKHFKANNKVSWLKHPTSLNANNNSYIYNTTKPSYNCAELNSDYNPSKTFELIVGHRNVIYAGIELLKSALDKPYCSKDPIIVTFFTELDSFCSFEETFLEWNKVLLELLNRGWPIIRLIRLNENINRNLKIISEIETCLFTGTYYPYYLNKYNLPAIPWEYVIVPTVGTLSCIGSQGINKFDNAFLIKDKQSTELQKQNINQLLKLSSPLSTTCKPLTSLELSSKVTLIEEKKGDRYTFNYGLPKLTMPLSLYKKNLYLNLNKISDDKIKKRISFFERRIHSFIKQIENYKYYDICSKKAIENMIKSSEYNSTTNSTSDSIIHIKNVIHMLEKYDNYHIGLFNDMESNTITKTSWLIKDYYTVLLQDSSILANINNGIEYHDSRLCTTISEPTMVNAYKHHFMNLWSEIPPIDKDKKSVVYWFKNQIRAIDNV